VLRVRWAVGRDVAHLTGLPVPADGSLAGLAARTGRALLCEDVSRDGRAGASAGLLLPGFGPGAVVPFADRDVSGSVLVVREHGRAPFTGQDLEALAGFTAQAATAGRLARRRAEYHDRIAVGLYQEAVQELFAAGMDLQSLAAAKPRSWQRAVQIARRLDRTIALIRAAVHCGGPEPRQSNQRA
jgi:GAF domain-containing protein